ncbi:MAG: hypothetical protein GIW97_05120, partial [Candidatus Eremiobacteraeota bacterium]|nr:hypothetical protein [Candidatus Eremiobacteraeota bacterium]
RLVAGVTGPLGNIPRKRAFKSAYACCFLGDTVLVGRGRGARVGAGVGVGGGSAIGLAGAGFDFTGACGAGPGDASAFGPAVGLTPRCGEVVGTPVGRGLGMPSAVFCGAGVACTSCLGAAVAGARVGAAVGCGVAFMGCALAGAAGAGDGFEVGAVVGGATLGSGVTACCATTGAAVGMLTGTAGYCTGAGVATTATCVGCGFGEKEAGGTGVGLGGALGFCLASSRRLCTGLWPASTGRATGFSMRGAWVSGGFTTCGTLFVR